MVLAANPMQANSHPQAPKDQKRYDRQIRIWGAHGQAVLERSEICMLGAGPAATETLKNLVLGGIASFTLLDDQVVTDEDLGNNFFYSKTALGVNRAEAATELLLKLNTSVNGAFANANAKEFLQNDPEYFKKFNLVIGTELTPTTAKLLSETLTSYGVHFICIRCHGPFGTLQITGPELGLIETKPESVAADLRLSDPWPELLALADAVDLESCDDIAHKHIPYALLLIKAVVHWRKERGEAPKNYQERKEFKELLSSWKRSLDGVELEEENFQEALSNAHLAWAQPGVPSTVRTILEDPATELTKDSSDFWVLVAALARFIENEGGGKLPLEGSIPDMTALTEGYQALQRVYRAQADAHCEAVHAHARMLLKAAGRPEDAIPAAAVKLFCKNARHLALVRPRRLVADMQSLPVECLRQLVESEDAWHPAGVLLALLAAGQFQEEHGRMPGETDEIVDPGWELDIHTVQCMVTQRCTGAGVSPRAVKDRDDVLLEVCRCASAAIHSIGAIMGGIAAQEAIKVLLRQFVPVHGVLVFDGIHGTSAVLDVQ